MYSPAGGVASWALAMPAPNSSTKGRMGCNLIGAKPFMGRGAVYRAPHQGARGAAGCRRGFATSGLTIGFVLMLLLDTALG